MDNWRRLVVHYERHLHICSPVIRAFYHQHLRQAGKPPKVALVAAIQRWLTVLNAILRHNLPWDLCQQNLTFNTVTLR